MVEQFPSIVIVFSEIIHHEKLETRRRLMQLLIQLGNDYDNEIVVVVVVVAAAAAAITDKVMTMSRLLEGG